MPRQRKSVTRQADTMVGNRYGRLSVISSRNSDGSPIGTEQNHQVFVRCDCGSEYKTSARGIFRGRTTSCGCARRDRSTTHNLSSHRLYAVWQSMKARCYQPSAIMYYAYGARGISICDKWRSDVSSFIQWALANGYKPGLQIDRIDNDGNYEPSNCQFVTAQKNQRNKNNNKLVSYNGRSICMAELSQISGVSYHTLRARIVKLGWSVEEATSVKVAGHE